jgi:hypothetical protein
MKKYCTYVQYPGILGRIFGWFLVGICEENQFSGYIREFVGNGNKILLLEMKPPLPPRFCFIPKDAKVILSATLFEKV